MAEASTRNAHRIYRIFFALISLVIFAADQTTKIMVQHAIPHYKVIPVIPGCFNLIHTENTGMAFSLFSDSPSSWKMAVMIGVSVALLIAVVAVWQSREVNWQAGVGLALILGGALSNLADRVRYGRVVDFLDVYYRSYHWPTFNLADSAIVVGAGFLILELLFSK